MTKPPIAPVRTFDGRLARVRPRARLAKTSLGLCRWRTVAARPAPEKAVIIFYPHTSGWDLVIGLAAKWALEFDVHWVGKDSLFRGPLGWVLRQWGGIAVDRSAATGSIARLAAEFSVRRRFLLALAPEGTRRYAGCWRSGFYHLALSAKVPLGLAFIDYPRREVGIAGYLDLSGDPARDMAAIAALYNGRRGRWPVREGPIRMEGSSPHG